MDVKNYEFSSNSIANVGFICCFLLLPQCKLSFAVFQTATPTHGSQRLPFDRWRENQKCGQLKTQFGAILRLLINAFAVFLLFRFGF